MSFDFNAMPSIQGKTALVTGANIGLGFETAKALSIKGAHVFLGSRNPEKGERAKSLILQEVPGASIEVINLDLASLRNIRSAAENIASLTSKLDLLVNNAGIMAMPETKTEDGFESQFGVNHLGHWALTSALLPLLNESESARVVTVTSTAHHLITKINYSDPHMREKYSAWNAYSQSKLANYFFAYGLHIKAKARNSSIQSILAHPGLSHTNLQVETSARGAAGRLGEFFKNFAARSGMEPWVGAQPQIRAAIDPSAKSGDFYGPRYSVKGAPVNRKYRRPGLRRNVDLLWELSERETGQAISF